MNRGQEHSGARLDSDILGICCGMARPLLQQRSASLSARLRISEIGLGNWMHMSGIFMATGAISTGVQFRQFICFNIIY